MNICKMAQYHQRTIKSRKIKIYIYIFYTYKDQTYLD